MKLVVTVEFGNAAMQTYGQATKAIQEAISRHNLTFHRPKPTDEGSLIMDANGNTVGSWEVTE